MIQDRDDLGLCQGWGVAGRSKKGSDPGSTVKGDLTGFFDGIEYKRESVSSIIPGFPP